MVIKNTCSWIVATTGPQSHIQNPWGQMHFRTQNITWHPSWRLWQHCVIKHLIKSAAKGKEYTLSEIKTINKFTSVQVSSWHPVSQELTRGLGASRISELWTRSPRPLPSLCNHCPILSLLLIPQRKLSLLLLGLTVASISFLRKMLCHHPLDAPQYAKANFSGPEELSLDINN